jgi:hypothetical protein
MPAEPSRPRSLEEMSADERAEVERELESGMSELPENEIKGVLGDKGLDFRKTDTFEPDLNAGLSQENDMPVEWMAILLGYFVFFVPGFVILWRSRRVPKRTKIIASVVMGAGVVAFFAYLSVRH